ncbi:MAG TPA: hypothetical protein VGT00_00915 [Methylomirabilota bacterium]|jgi:hypothetical protein|nr:hypothetical protein [Methylomirabilota bacterium]
MPTVDSKLRSGLVHYRRCAEDAAHAVTGARSKAARAELVAELRAASWWEGRYAVLLEICESGRRPEELLAAYANRLPGRKVPEPPPEPATTLAPSPSPVRPAAAERAAPRRRPAASWRWALAVAASLTALIALLQ